MLKLKESESKHLSMQQIEQHSIQVFCMIQEKYTVSETYK